MDKVNGRTISECWTDLSDIANEWHNIIESIPNDGFVGEDVRKELNDNLGEIIGLSTKTFFKSMIMSYGDCHKNSYKHPDDV